MLALGLAAGAVALIGGIIMLGAPVLGAYALVAMSHLDGIMGLVDKHLPVSTFKLMTAAVLAVLMVTARNNPALLGRPRPSVPMLLTMLFAGWLCFSHVMSDHMDAGRSHTVGFLSTLLLVPIVALTVNRVAHLRWMALILVGSGVVSAGLVVLEAKFGMRLLPALAPEEVAAWQGEVRSAGASAYNPTTAAHLMLVSLLVGAVLTLWDRSVMWRALWACGTLACLAALWLMGARSAILGLGVAGCMILWSVRHSRYLPLAGILAVAAGLAALPFVPDSLWERFAVVVDFLDGGNTSDRTLLRRLSYNLIGVELWLQNPLVGIGPGAFPDLYAGPDFRWYPGREQAPRQLHNSYMEVLTETGVIGLALFLGVVLGAWRMALGAMSGTSEAAVFARALATAMAAFLVASLFMPNEDNKYLWILVALCVRAAWIAQQDHRKDIL